MAKITLDAKTFQALASATRLTVLRALDERRKTLTELARDLQLNKATVHEHLQLLTAAGLVKKRDDEGRKWIYYELTWTGEKLLHPQETTTFSVLLGLSVAAAGGGVAMLGRALGWWLASTPMVSMDAEPPREMQDMAGTSQTQAAPGDAGSGGGSASTADSESNSALRLNDGDPMAATDPATDPSTFLDDGGYVSLALLAASTVFTSLALLLRRHLRPGKFVPPAEAGPEDRLP